MIKIPLPPLTYWLKFRDEVGSVSEVEVTKEIYEGPPSKNQIGGYSLNKIPPNSYADQDGKQFLANVGLGTYSVALDQISSDELTVAGLARLDLLVAKKADIRNIVNP